VVIHFFCALAIYLLWRGFYFEPNRLRVERFSRSDFGVNMVLAHLSDLHLNRWGRLHQSLITRLEAEAPQAIVLTGDYVKTKRGFSTLAKLLEHLTEIAPVYAVLGDNDQEDPETENRLVAIFRHNNARVLMNQQARLLQNNQQVYLVGLEDPHLGKADFIRALNQIPEVSSCPIIVLAHSPEVLKVPGISGDLILTGHTHGGQICLPGGIALLTNTKGIKRMYKGLIPWNGRALYINRGLGTARIPARLFCLPELAVFHLYKENKKEGT
jgi:predicted MPP superfamily phosphohydrolase